MITVFIKYLLLSSTDNYDTTIIIQNPHTTDVHTKSALFLDTRCLVAASSALLVCKGSIASWLSLCTFHAGGLRSTASNICFSVRFHYSLLGYRSQQWLHLYNFFSRRFPGDESPAYEFTSSLFELNLIKLIYIYFTLYYLSCEEVSSGKAVECIWVEIKTQFT
jgi:hypothetical protein